MDPDAPSDLLVIQRFSGFNNRVKQNSIRDAAATRTISHLPVQPS